MEEEDLAINGDGSSPLTIDENSESGDRIIYPWMKKIHVAGAGEFLLAHMTLKSYIRWFYNRKSKRNN